MIRTLRLVAFFLIGALVLRATVAGAVSVESAGAPKIAPAQAASIEKLIEQLGSEQYFLRHQAEAELVKRGADAFDLLQQAESNPDLEIATSAHYILQQIRIEWTRPEDSADVHAIMHRYGDLSKAERAEKMDALAALGEDEGLRALCRIARFEPAPQLARYAALKVMLAKSLPGRGTEIIATELGDSQRTPARWLRTYAEQLGQPNRVLDRWLELIDEETALLAEDSRDTQVALVFRLAAFHLELSTRNSQPDAIFANLLRRTDLCTRQQGHFQEFLAVVLQGMSREEQLEFLGPASYAPWLLEDKDGVDFALAHAMNWLCESEQWKALSLIEDHFADAIRDNRLLIYFSAVARWKQGRVELAEEFAERAFSLDAEDAANRLTIGELVGELGRHDWAEREWWYVVETFPVLDDNSLYARSRLATLRLHDRGEDQRAAMLLAEVCDAVEADANLKAEIRREARWRARYNQYRAQREYFQACHAAAEGDYSAQRKHLDAAYGFDPEDADVLIAMYHSPGADEAYHQNAISRARGAAKKVAEMIKQQPDNAQPYNHWAWLVSNTEGDYVQAVKHSLRSLELSPGSPSYLDTLGRCYYAAGDLDNAVKAQREAVRLHPHLQVMHNQLQLFESALAEREQN